MPGLEFRYVGKDSLPTRLSEFDVDRYFALTESDIFAINQKFRRDGRAGAASMQHRVRPYSNGSRPHQPGTARQP